MYYMMISLWLHMRKLKKPIFPQSVSEGGGREEGGGERLHELPCCYRRRKEKLKTSFDLPLCYYTIARLYQDFFPDGRRGCKNIVSNDDFHFAYICDQLQASSQDGERESLPIKVVVMRATASSCIGERRRTT
jgi:hypothetical protein